MIDLGDEDPLYTRNISNGPPDRRRVSLRWFAAAVLTGVFSVLLVGGALQAAIGLDDIRSCVRRSPTAWRSAMRRSPRKATASAPCPRPR